MVKISGGFVKVAASVQAERERGSWLGKGALLGGENA